MYFIFSSDIGLIVSDIKSSRMKPSFPVTTLLGFREIINRGHFRYKNNEKESDKNPEKAILRTIRILVLNAFALFQERREVCLCKELDE